MVARAWETESCCATPLRVSAHARTALRPAGRPRPPRPPCCCAPTIAARQAIPTAAERNTVFVIARPDYHANCFDPKGVTVPLRLLSWFPPIRRCSIAASSPRARRGHDHREIVSTFAVSYGAGLGRVAAGSLDLPGFRRRTGRHRRGGSRRSSQVDPDRYWSAPNRRQRTGWRVPSAEPPHRALPARGVQGGLRELHPDRDRAQRQHQPDV